MLPQQPGGCKIFPQVEKPIALANCTDFKLLEGARYCACMVMGYPGFRYHNAFPAAAPGTKTKIRVFVIKGIEQIIKTLHLNETRPINGKRRSDWKQCIPWIWQRSRIIQKLLGRKRSISNFAPPEVRNADGHIAEFSSIIENERGRRKNGRILQTFYEGTNKIRGNFDVLI